MLRRDRQVRKEAHRWVDGCIFALALWMGHALRRAIGHGIHWQAVSLQPDQIAGFQEYFWLFLVVIPMTPLVLDWQGFYDKQLISSRSQRIWQLAWAYLICVVGLILIEFILRLQLARGVFVLFGACSFG